MSLSFSFPVGNSELTITAAKPQELSAMFKALGGDEKELIARIKANAQDCTKQRVRVVDEAPKAEGSSGGSGSSVTPADPWSDDAASTTQTASPSSDPWADESPADAAPAPGGVTSVTDKFGRKFTMGLPEAPACDCEPSQPAARMDAKAKGSGKGYSKWVCAKAAGKAWKDKCDLDDFVN